MIPHTILRKLRGLRRRERVLRFLWGTARVVAVALVLLLLACLGDWLYDRQQDTPEWFRLTLSYTQFAIWGLLAILLIGWPLVRPLRAPRLARWVEKKNPHLDERVISAVLLNRPGADTLGMSRELIDKVTVDAERQASELNFKAAADHRRLGWSVLVLVPVLLVFAVPLILWPEMMPALLARQFLADEEIPRSVHLKVIDTPDVWPVAEKGTIRFQATGWGVDPEAVGVVRLTPLDKSSGDMGAYVDLKLKYEKMLGDQEALYVAQVPEFSSSFSFRAYLVDGRTGNAGQITYVPRPVVTDLFATVLLPEAIAVTPKKGKRYTEPQPRGDVAALAGSEIELSIKTQKPIKAAEVWMLKPAGTVEGKPTHEIVSPVIKMTVYLDDNWAEKTFEVQPGETAYQVVVEDKYGFDNRPAPRRLVRIVAEEAPQVFLLPDRFLPPGEEFTTSQSEDFDVEGLPIPPGGAVRVAYQATGKYGLGTARFLFRVLKKMESGEAPPEEEKWQVLPLVEVSGSDRTGEFDPRQGAFKNSGDKDVPFHAVPSDEPEARLGRILGGGRFNFKTTGIPDGKGGLLDLKPGDQIEYCVEVFADKEASPNRPSARSETRVRSVVSPEDFRRWLADTLQEENRIRRLDAQQRSLEIRPPVR